MHCLDRFFESLISRHGGLEHKKNLLGFHHFSLPTVYGLNPCDDIRAGSQPRIYHLLANPDGFFFITYRNQNNKYLM